MEIKVTAITIQQQLSNSCDCLKSQFTCFHLTSENVRSGELYIPLLVSYLRGSTLHISIYRATLTYCVNQMQ